MSKLLKGVIIAGAGLLFLKVVAKRKGATGGASDYPLPQPVDPGYNLPSIPEDGWFTPMPVFVPKDLPEKVNTNLFADGQAGLFDNNQFML